MDRDVLARCMKFKSTLSSIINDINDVAQCLIPLNEEDRKIIREGMESLEAYKNGLDDAETLYELNRYIDIDKFLEEEDTICAEIEKLTDSSFRIFLDSLQEAARGE